MEINKILELFSSKTKLEEIDLKNKASYKVGPIKVHFRKFKLDEFTSLSILEGKGMFGLIKINTVVLTSSFKDIPLFSYDYMNMMGKKYYLYEMYDTFVGNKRDYSTYIASSNLVKDIHDYKTKESEMDKYLLSETIRKNPHTKEEIKLLDEQTERFFNLAIEEYLSSNEVDVNEKHNKNAKYVHDLLTYGGVSTDLFTKKLGLETTTEIYERILFGIKD